LRTPWGAGFHAPPEGGIDASAYDSYIGRWSRLFVPALLSAADLRVGYRVLDVATGSGEAALEATSAVGASGMMVGVDISSAMLDAAVDRMAGKPFFSVVANGQSLPFRDASFDAVLCHLGLMFFPEPALGLAEARRVLRPGCRAGVCVISTAERAPMWGVLANTLCTYLPDLARELQLSFALAGPGRLEGLLASAAFRDICVQTVAQEGAYASFEQYWAAIESGPGLIPQAYRVLPAPMRAEVRDAVRERLTPFDHDGRLVMSVEMVIGSGRA
jgi:SAM-dependent methyltransferase